MTDTPAGQLPADLPPVEAESRAPRIAALDLIRGVAVLGILAINITGFALPQSASDTPGLFGPTSPADLAGWGLAFLLFEGKMRALFSLLFGASMLLFVERAEAAGADGDWMQLRRLFFLLLFGWLHYILLWWGDILFVYALCGSIALCLSGLRVRTQVGLALAIFAFWHGWGMVDSQLHPGAQSLHDGLVELHLRLASDAGQDRLPALPAIAARLTAAPLWPLVMTLYTIGETLPLMLLGMALYRTGFFAGRWPRKALWALVVAGLGLGLPMAAALWRWAAAWGFPPLLMPDILSYWAGPEHLLMALAYAAGLMLAAPRLLGTWLGQRLAATGRMAFTNYLGTTLVMTFLFHGWGLGLEGRFGRAGLWGFTLAGWAVMLGWSKPWLARHRQGPLEALWRALTWGQFRRAD